MNFELKTNMKIKIIHILTKTRHPPDNLVIVDNPSSQTLQHQVPQY